MKLERRHAIITGAGAGIGRAIARRFREEGANVVVSDIDMSRARAVADEIGALAVCCDVADEGAVHAMFEAARREYGPVDILVNNAGGAIVGGAMQMFKDSTREYMDKLLGVNLTGAILCAREVVNEMAERRSGRIISMASIRALSPGKGNIFYATAKGGIISFTMALAAELGEYGVTVNSISPGAIASREGPARMKTYLNRPGDCSEVASLAAFLASDEAAFITGENVVIDGGRVHASLGES